MSALSYNYFVGNGVKTAYEFTKEMNDKATVLGLVNQVATSGTWDSGTGFFTFDVAPVSGAQVWVYRATDNNEAVAVYPNKSYISSDNLDADFRQSLMQVQELQFAIDQAVLLNAGAPGYAASAAASAAAALASELAAAISAAAALVSENNSAASETAAGLSEAATALDAIATAADVVSTNADAVSTAADAVQTALDALATAADVVSTNADVVTTNADAASTAQDAIDTAADLVETNQDTIDAAASAVSADQARVLAEAAAAALIWNDVIFISNANSPYTILEAHRGVLFAVDTAAGNVIVNLPLVSAVTQPFSLGFKKTTSDGNIVTINTSGTDTLDGSTSQTITTLDSGFVAVADEDPTPDEWVGMNFGAGAANLTVDNYIAVTDFTAGTTTQLTMSVDPGSENNTFISFDGVVQHNSEYSVSATTVTFTSAIPVGVTTVQIKSGSLLSIGVPADSTVSTVKLVDASVTLPKLATEVTNVIRNKNYIINPTFVINQRNFIGGAASNTYTFDRWRVDNAGTLSLPDASGYVTVGTVLVQHRIEEFQIPAGVEVTLSWDGTAEATDWVSGGGVWTGFVTGGLKTFTTGSALAGVPNANIVIGFKNGTVRNVKLEIGSVATPFEYPDLPTELAKCQRYYETSDGVISTFMQDPAHTNTREVMYINYQASKRVSVPTITLTDNAATVGKVSIFSNVSAGITNGITSILGSRTKSGFYGGKNQASATSYGVIFSWTSDAEL